MNVWSPTHECVVYPLTGADGLKKVSVTRWHHEAEQIVGIHASLVGCTRLANILALVAADDAHDAPRVEGEGLVETAELPPARQLLFELRSNCWPLAE